MKNSKTIGVIKRAIFFVMVGLNLASCKKDGSPDEFIDYHQTAITQFIAVDKTNFAYRILGNKGGVPLVMISSLGSSMDDWDPAITNGLALNNKVIIFDIEGVGSSSGKTPANIAEMAKGVVKFIRALGYSKVNLMGFSMGSFISQQIVLTEPALVKKMILTGTGPKGAEGLSNLPNLLAASAGLSQEEFLLKFAFTSSPASIEAGKLSYKRIQKRVVDRDLPVTAESFTAQVIAVLGWAQPYPDALLELKNITQPVLIAQGEFDIPVPVINAINISKSIPRAQLIVYQDAGHGAIFQYPEKFLRSALIFLDK